MRQASKEASKRIPLSKVVIIPPKSYPSTNIEHDSIQLLDNYLPSASTLEIVDLFSAGLRGGKSGRMLSVTGPYGSGKSTMAVFLGALLAPKDSREWKAAFKVLKREPENYAHTLVYARNKARIHEAGMIRCIVTARREPISVTLLRALDKGLAQHLGKSKRFPAKKLLNQCLRDIKNNKVPDSSKVIEIIEVAAKMCPVVFIIDEFGKNVEYFASDDSQQSDLFLLQELAEMSGEGRKIPLSIITLQHMAFEEYATGASAAQKREWAKIQGRFEDIPFSNSPDQTRVLISNMIKPGGTAYSTVLAWARKASRDMKNLGVSVGPDPNLIASCYPLNPLALEVLPELCSRYGQHERTLLSFIADAQKHTIATFIDENSWDPKSSPPTVGLDTLYDYFISGTSMIHSSSVNISRLMEIETIIRDAHGLDATELKALKTVGILNLIGRSGYLRASRRLIDYAVGRDSGQALEILKEKSIITYREHADEYRIWHGTDIDIASKLYTYRKRYQRTSLSNLLNETVRLEPVIAAKHSIRTGTMRLFERRFTLEYDPAQGEEYDGVILYRTNKSEILESEKPIVIVTASDTTELRFAAVEVSAIRDILESDEAVAADWVARKELEERLADSEVVLYREFARAYGSRAEWEYRWNGKKKKLRGKPGMITSKICDTWYHSTPVIRNEMINRTILSGQGSAAKKKILEAMIEHADKERFGIEGYGPERAVYEAVLYENRIHVQDSSTGWKLCDPPAGRLAVWSDMLDKITSSKSRIPMTDIYRVAKMPPYGMKDGPVQILVVAMIIIHRDSIALYEHGTFVPKLQIETAERMTKNPEHFEIKHFESTAARGLLLQQVATKLGIASSGSLLDVVGHLVRTVSSLPPHIKTTKRLDKHTTAVRDEILAAVEPDTLLFESLPKALGYKTEMSENQIGKFSKALAKSVQTLQNAYEDLFSDMCDMLFDATGIDDRKKISRTSSVMLQSVTDQKMKVFLTALSSDVLERDKDWINYVALSLTDVPPTDWKDDHRTIFENNLVAMSRKFKRLASIHFASVSDNFVKPSYQVTVTHADGSEHHNVVSLRPAQRKRIEQMANKILADMKKDKLGGRELEALIAILSSRSR